MVYIYFMRDVLVVVSRKCFLHFLYFQFSSFIASTLTHTQTHIRELPKFSPLFMFPQHLFMTMIHIHTHKIYPAWMHAAQNYIAQDMDQYQKSTTNNYSANFHFFCLKKQCNCFRVFNDTTTHSTKYSSTDWPHSTLFFCILWIMFNAI